MQAERTVTYGSCQGTHTHVEERTSRPDWPGSLSPRQPRAPGTAAGPKAHPRLHSWQPPPPDPNDSRRRWPARLRNRLPTVYGPSRALSPSVAPTDCADRGMKSLSESAGHPGPAADTARADAGSWDGSPKQVQWQPRQVNGSEGGLAATRTRVSRHVGHGWVRLCGERVLACREGSVAVISESLGCARHETSK